MTSQSWSRDPSRQRVVGWPTVELGKRSGPFNHLGIEKELGGGRARSDYIGFIGVSANVHSVKERAPGLIMITGGFFLQKWISGKKCFFFQKLKNICQN